MNSVHVTKSRILYWSGTEYISLYLCRNRPHDRRKLRSLIQLHVSFLMMHTFLSNFIKIISVVCSWKGNKKRYRVTIACITLDCSRIHNSYQVNRKKWLLPNNSGFCRSFITICVFLHKLLNESWQQHAESVVICFDLAVGSLLNRLHQFRPQDIRAHCNITPH